MKRRVIVTGASGLIGRATVRLLHTLGFDVIAFTHRPSPNTPNAVHVDLLNGAERRRALASAQADSLIHLAWHGGSNRWAGQENATWSDASLALAYDFKAAGGRRAVFVGSCAEYDWAHATLSELTPLRPTTPYGQAKAKTATSLLEASDLGLSLAWARVFFCYGPGEPPGRLMGDLIRGLLANEPVDCTDGLQRRDFLYVDDVARALLHVLTCDLEGAVNIGSGVALPVRSLIMDTARAVGRPDLIRLGARSRPDADPGELVADIKKLAATGFSPRYTLSDGIRAMIDEESGRLRRHNDLSL